VKILRINFSFFFSRSLVTALQHSQPAESIKFIPSISLVVHHNPIHRRVSKYLPPAFKQASNLPKISVGTRQSSFLETQAISLPTMSFSFGKQRRPTLFFFLLLLLL
jgi:hypothetical protein